MTQIGNELIIDRTVEKTFSILYVEDETEARNALASILARKYPQIRIDLAENGLAGLEMFKARNPNLVITDNDMPIMTGAQMVSKIKLLRPQTVILFLTAKPDQCVFSLTQTKELVQYLPKPTKIKSLFHLIDGYIDACNCNDNHQ